MSSLLPPECNGILDAPYNLVEAISLALRFLKFEELPHVEDIPPKRIWMDPEAMSSHWTQVEANHKARYGGGGSAPQEQNDAASGLVL